MSNEISNPMTFEQRVMEKMKDQIADLIKPEELRAIVDKGIEKAFFERPCVSDSYGRKEYRQSLVEQLIDAHLKAEMMKQVRAWIEANPDKILAEVRNMIAKGVSQIVVQQLINQFQWPIEQAMDQVFARKQ